MKDKFSKGAFVPVLFLTVFALFSCSDGDDVTASVASLIRADDPIVLSLPDGDSFSVSSADASDFISIVPQVDASIELHEAGTLCIYPKERLKYNTQYSLKADLRRLTGKGPRKWKTSFSTLPPMVSLSDGILECDGREEGLYHIDMDVTSLDPLDSAALERSLSVKTRGGRSGTSGTKVIWHHSEDGLLHGFSITDIAALQSPYKVEVGLKNAEYGLDESQILDVPAKGVFCAISSFPGDEPYSYKVAFSSVLDEKQDFSQLVSMPGAGRLIFMVKGNILNIYASGSRDDRQFISIARSVRSASGECMENDFERFFTVTQEGPSIGFVTEGTILPSSSGMKLYFHSSGYEKVRVRVHRIFENNVLQWLQNNGLSSCEAYIGDVARVVADTTFALSRKDDPKLLSNSTYGLDLSSIIKVQKGAIYKVEIRGVDSLLPLSGDVWESEYYFGSYEDYEKRARMILSTDLSLVAKAGDDGQYVIFVMDVMSAKGVTGARVALYNDVNQVVAEGVTDGDGKFACTVQDDDVRTVVAGKGKDRIYMPLIEGRAMSLSSFDVAGVSSRKGQKGYIYGERGVWRPGDAIHITFVSLLDEGVLPADHPVTAVLRNPGGQQIHQLTQRKGHNGMYSFTFETPVDAPTGNWEVEILSGGVSFRKTIKIETVKPNNILVDLSLNDSPAVPSSDVRGTVRANFLSGMPAAGLAVRLEMELSKGKTTFDGYDGYTFEDCSRMFSKQSFEMEEIRTDSEGVSSFVSSLDLGRNAPGFLDAVFTTRIFEKGGDFSIDRMAAKVSPYGTYLGLHVPLRENTWGEKYLDKSSEHTFDVAALRSDGSPSHTPVEVEVEIYRLGWSWWWGSSEGELASYSKDSFNTPYKLFRKKIVDGHLEMKLSFSSEESGFYFMRVTDTSGGHAASEVFMVSSSQESGSECAGESAVKLSTKLDKDKYRVSEKARLVIPSSKGARALVSVEKGNRVLREFWVECSDTQTVIPIDIEENMAPNAFVSVTLVQPHGTADNDAPLRMFGLSRINVEEPSTHLHPVIVIPEEVEPGSELSVRVREEDGRPMSYTLALVDEGLLSLTRFKTPDPWSRLYAGEALGVHTWDLYDLVIGAYGARMEPVFAIGGDADNIVFNPGAQVERFKPVSLFFGPFDIKAKGTGCHTVKIPQYVGKLRVMVISTDGRAFGSSEKNLSVTMPAVARATLPRAIGTGETIDLPVTVYTAEDGVGRVDVSISASGALAVAGASSSVIDGSKKGDHTVWFTLKSSSGAGAGHLKVLASCAGRTSSEQLDIQVRESMPLTTNSVVKVIEGGASSRIEVPFAGRAGTNTVKVEASSIPAMNLAGRLSYLRSYPHGCLEQTVSSAFPLLYASSVANLPAEEVSDGENAVKAVLSKLPSFSCPGGGMSYWSGGYYSEGVSVWGSVYAAHFIVEASARGYAIPEGMKSQLLKYVRKVASDNSYDFSSRAYACYVLSLAGTPSKGDMNRLREAVSKAPEDGMWLLAASYAAGGVERVAREIISGGSASASISSASSPEFCSAERTVALSALVYGLLGEKVDQFRCVRKLSGWLDDSHHYMSTQSVAWALNAVAGYALCSKGGKMNVTVNTPLEKVSLESDGKLVSSALKPGNGSTLQLDISNKSESPVYILASSTGLPEKGTGIVSSNGVSLDIRYTAPDGSQIDPSALAQGTDFVITAYVSNTSASRDYTNLALTQIFPSGWEIRHDDNEGIHQDYRDDRVYSYMDLPRGGSRTVRIRATAAYRGRFYLPSAVCEAMYDASVNASTAGMWCSVN